MKKRVTVTQVVDVEIDEKKFDETFMREFRESFYNFDTIDQHIEHLAQLRVRGLAEPNMFIEGYGLAKDMGIVFTHPYGHSCEMDIEKIIL